ncbi:MAG: hypothetical protein U9P44_01760 [archaeon]|nr:hypothetical protein [archaeon]
MDKLQQIVEELGFKIATSQTAQENNIAGNISDNGEIICRYALNNRGKAGNSYEFNTELPDSIFISVYSDTLIQAAEKELEPNTDASIRTKYNGVDSYKPMPYVSIEISSDRINKNNVNHIIDILKKIKKIKDKDKEIQESLKPYIDTMLRLVKKDTELIFT